MAKYQVFNKAGVAIRSAAENDDANIISRLGDGEEFEGQLFAANVAFVEIKPKKDGDPKTFAFVFGNVREIGPQPPEPINEAEYPEFCIRVTDAARRFGPERNYLMAAAYCASDLLKNVGKDDPKDRIGPFRISREDWTHGMALAAAKGETFTQNDRSRWYRQPVIAALLAVERGTELNSKIDHKANAIELYFAQCYGAGADVVLKAEPTKLCSTVIPDTAPAGSYAAELRAGSQTIQAVLDGLKDCLIKGLAKALEIIDAMPPDIRYFRPTDRESPWFSVALQEKALNIAELPGTENNPRIVLYHKVAGIDNAADELPWCASFVTYCMKTCGVQVAVDSVPKVKADGTNHPATTEAWKGWGNPISDAKPEEFKLADIQNAPIGSVVVLKAAPEHVGFLNARPAAGATTVEILGGNQGDQLRIDPFSISAIRACRWLPTSTGVQAGDGPLLITAAQFSAIFPLAPNADQWATALTQAWRRFGFTSKNARAAFLGITGSETGGFLSGPRERLNYSPADAARVFKGQGPCRDANGNPTQICRDKLAIGEQAFANWIYANINGNGAEDTGDGFKYRGGGIIQLTGRGNYKACVEHPLGRGVPGILDNPDLLIDPLRSAHAAAWYLTDLRDALPGIDVDSEATYLTTADAKVGVADANAIIRRKAFRTQALGVLSAG